MAKSLLALSFVVTTSFVSASADAACAYEPGGDPAMHTIELAAIPADQLVLVTVPAGTRVQTDSGSHPGVRKDVGCLKYDHQAWVDRREVVGDTAYEVFLKGCLNDTFVVGGVAVPQVQPAPVRTDDDWVACLKASRFAVEDMSHGSQCAASFRCEVDEDGNVHVGQVLYEDCACAPKAHQLRSETELDGHLADRVRDTPLSKLLGVSSGTAPIVPGTPPANAISATEIRLGVTSYLTDVDATGLAWKLDETWWLDNGYLDLYKPNQCTAGPRFGVEGGAGAVLVGAADHAVFGAFGALTVTAGSGRARLGGYIGADPSTAMVAGMPLFGGAGRLWQSSQGRVELWLGGDVVMPMGPSWAVLGGQGNLSLDARLGASQRTRLGVELGVGGVGAVAGDCESGSLLSGNVHIGF